MMEQFYSRSLLLCTVLLAGFACKPSRDARESSLEATNVAATPLGQFKGVKSISNIINSRLLIGDDFYLLRNVQRNQGFGNLENIMGGYAGVGIKNKYSNGIPNALNMFTWTSVIQNFAEEIATRSCMTGFFSLNRAARDVVCTANPSGRFKLTADSQSLPRAPLPTKGAPGELPWEKRPLDLWHLVMQEDAPASEAQAWIKWVQSQEFQKTYKTPETRLKAAMSAILLNPYFLLEN